MKEEKILSGEAMEVEEEKAKGYLEEVLQELVAQSPECATENYFSRQMDLREHMRGVLLHWLVEVQQKYRLQSSTYFLTVALVDLYLSKCSVARTQLQLVGVTALWVAAKYQEVYHVPTLNSLVHLCDSAYSLADILQMEGCLLAEIGFRFTPTPSAYFEPMAAIADLCPKDTHLGRYLLEATTFDLKFNLYSRHMVAFAIVFFIKKIRGLSLGCAETRIYDKYALNEKTMKACIRDVCCLWQQIDSIQTMTTLKNKYMHKKYLEVARIRMCEKAK